MKYTLEIKDDITHKKFKDFVINNRKNLDVTKVEFIAKVVEDKCKDCGHIEDYHWSDYCHYKDCGCKKYDVSRKEKTQEQNK